MPLLEHDGPIRELLSGARTVAVVGLSDSPARDSHSIGLYLLEAGYEPHNVKRLYIHGAEKSDTWVDIRETIDIKIEALKKHVSQSDTHDVDKWIHEWGREEGKEKGLEFAEAYRVMILQKDEEGL